MVSVSEASERAQNNPVGATRVAGRVAAFLVLYPSGGVCQSFPPGPENELKAKRHAQNINGLLVAVPLLADYRTGPEPSAYTGEKPRPANKPNITALPEPGSGTLTILSGQRAGMQFTRSDKNAPADTDPGHRWWSGRDNAWRNWTQVQQHVGEADWTVGWTAQLSPVLADLATMDEPGDLVRIRILTGKRKGQSFQRRDAEAQAAHPAPLSPGRWLHEQDRTWVDWDEVKSYIGNEDWTVA